MSKYTYSKIDSYVWRITQKHLTRLYPNKGWTWKNNKYFKPDFTGISKNRNIFTDPENNKTQLMKMSWTPIIRHNPIKYNYSPDDQSLKEYFKKRDEKLFCKEHIKSMQIIARRNKYKCRVCGLSLVGEEKIKINYIVPKKIDGQNKYINFEALHETCYKNR